MKNGAQPEQRVRVTKHHPSRAGIAVKAAAQRLFPGAGVLKDTADALLLAEYCRRRHLGISQ